MKGNVFGAWLKEFCALVFTQSVQAFLLAIILSMVVLLLSNDTNNTDNITSNQAAGVLAIIALASISKMEDLIKKLFGLSSSVTDTSMKGGKGGLIGGMMALQMMKKPLDNIPKMATGARNIVGGIKDRKVAEENRAAALQKAKSRYNELHPAGGESVSDGTDSTSTPSGESSSSSTSTGASSSSNTSRGSGTGSGNGSDLNDVKTLNVSNMKVDNSNINAGGNDKESKQDKLLKDKHKLQDELERIEKEYSAKVKEANKRSRSGVSGITSGVLETTGGIVGATTGAAVGLGTGDSPLRTAVTGMGIGDTIGQKMVDIPSSVTEGLIGAKDSVKKMKINASDLKKANDKLAKEIKNISDI